VESANQMKQDNDLSVNIALTRPLPMIQMGLQESGGIVNVMTRPPFRGHLTTFSACTSDTSACCVLAGGNHMPRLKMCTDVTPQYRVLGMPLVSWESGSH